MAAELAIVDAPPQRATLAPRNMEEGLRFSEYLSQSSFVPKDFQGKPANVLVAVQFGMEIGLGPMQALQSIAVINGRPTLWGDAMLALVMNHPAYEWHKEYLEGERKEKFEDWTLAGVFIIKRRGQDEHLVRFSVHDAKLASLWGKEGPWKQYPDRMLKLRARGWALRDKFPDALKGMIAREEAEDFTQGRLDNTGHRVVDAMNVVANVERAGAEANAFHGGKAAAEKGPTITREQAKQFADAWKASGKPTTDVRPFLKDCFGVERSLDIPAARFGEAMSMATIEPEVIDETAVKVVEACKALGYNDAKIDALLKENHYKLPALLEALQAEADAGSAV